jgi:hypothetical protein
LLHPVTSGILGFSVSVAAHLAFAIAATLAFCGWGRLFLRRAGLRFNSGLDGIFFSGSLGMAFIVGVATCMAALHLFYRPLLACFLFGVWGARHLFRVRVKSVPALLIACLLVFPLLWTLAPPGLWDDTMYHLPIARSLLANHTMHILDGIRYPYFPFNGEILFALGLSLDEASAQAMSWICLLFLCCGVCGSFSRERSAAVIVLALFFLLSSQLLLHLGSVCYVDIVVALFVTAAILAMARYFSEGGNAWPVLSAVFIGTAVGAKYSAAIVLAGILLFLGLKRDWKAALRYSLIAGVVGMPWYARNLFYTGTPVWPFLPQLAGGLKHWTAADFRGFIQNLRDEEIGRSLKHFIALPFYLADGKAIFGAMGRGVLLPWNFIRGMAAVNPFLWPGVFASAAFGFRHRRESRFFFTVIAVFTAAWFLSANLSRYFLPIVPLLCIVAAEGYGDWMSRQSLIRPKVVFALLISLSAGYYLYHEFRQWKLAGLPPKPIERVQPLYPAVAFAASLEGTTYGFHCENMNYYGHGKIIGDWFGPARYQAVYDSLGDPGRLRALLRDLGVRRLLLSKKKVRPEGIVLDEHFIRIYEDDAAVIYSIDARN